MSYNELKSARFKLKKVTDDLFHADCCSQGACFQRNARANILVNSWRSFGFLAFLSQIIISSKSAVLREDSQVLH